MRILALDDEPLALEMLTDAINQAAPGARVDAFSAPSKLLLSEMVPLADVAFLDIQTGGMTG